MKGFVVNSSWSGSPRQILLSSITCSSIQSNLCYKSVFLQVGRLKADS